MAKVKPADIAPKIVSLLEPLDSNDRGRVIQAALMLLGEGMQTQVASAGPGIPTVRAAGVGQVNEKSYFDSKKPNMKIEELAVAARYREEHEGAATGTLADFQRVIRAARRDFDSTHFHRDMGNARAAGLFNRGTAKDAIQLSHYGQSYIDLLPDRAALKQLSKPKQGRRPAAKKAKRS